MAAFARLSVSATERLLSPCYSTDKTDPLAELIRSLRPSGKAADSRRHIKHRERAVRVSVHA